jgi:predicted nucleotidyltransferase
MLPHHQAAIQRLTEHFQADPNFLALIIGGSIAKGWEKPDSDVDIVLVVTDEEYARRTPERRYHYFTRDFCDYPGGYVDGKIVNLDFLKEVADHGSEPARAAFVGAFIAYSHIPELEAVLRAIPVYPEVDHQHKIESFYAQMEALRWYVGEAEKRNDRYLMMHVISDLVLFGGRMVLAHNRILYPYHKWFMTQLCLAPQRPPDLMERIDDMLAAPCKESADRFCESIIALTDWDTPPEGWPTRFMEESEWNWRRQRPPLEDC